MANKTDKLIRSLRNATPELKVPLGNMFLPNHSGDHSKGHIRVTPTQDLEIPNKKYVDDAFTAHTHTHASTTGQTANDHHARYTDAEAQIVADSRISTHAAITDVHHAEFHTIASHSDTTATGAELETLTDGSNADALHTHAGGAHTIASHSDTTATGAELETLTDDSMADSLHRHSELSASDGTPNQVILINPDGTIMISLSVLPTTDPHIANQLWVNGNTLMISTG